MTINIDRRDREILRLIHDNPGILQTQVCNKLGYGTNGHTSRILKLQCIDLIYRESIELEYCRAFGLHVNPEWSDIVEMLLERE